MSFPAHPTYSDFERTNRPYASRLEAFLVSVSGDKAAHARFLNTLSMMEHMGSRRIVMTQSAPALGQETLKHMAEEARHAFFFKRQADRFAGASLEYDDADMIAPAFARMYFKRLESFVVAGVKNEAEPRRMTYLYMSMIIEFRAVWAFSIYQSVLDARGVPLSLKSLLAEEQGHLAGMRASLEALDAARSERVARFLKKEQALFVRLLERLESSADKNAAAA
ncbi:MAG: hypothetical protein AAB223_03865 [Pseudomonadota bacterium]